MINKNEYHQGLKVSTNKVKSHKYVLIRLNYNNSLLIPSNNNNVIDMFYKTTRNKM